MLNTISHNFKSCLEILLNLFCKFEKLRRGFTLKPFTGYEQKCCLSIADVNECSLDNSVCHQNASCYNTEGGFACHCNKGFFGNGSYCAGKNLFIFEVITLHTCSSFCKISECLFLRNVLVLVSHHGFM